MKLHGIPDSGLRRIAKVASSLRDNLEEQGYVVDAELEWVDPNEMVPTEHSQDQEKVTDVVEKLSDGEWPEDFPALFVVEREGVLEIVDGHHRWRGAVDAGVESVPVYVFPDDTLFHLEEDHSMPWFEAVDEVFGLEVPGGTVL